LDANGQRVVRIEALCGASSAIWTSKIYQWIVDYPLGPGPE
jgi:hypothetical protein